MLIPYKKAQHFSNALKNRNFCRALCHLLGLFIAILFVRIRRHFTRIKKNKILFTSFTGAYDCNPKYICEEILRRNLPWDIVWVIGGEDATARCANTDFPSSVILTMAYSPDFYKHLYSSRILVDNNATIVGACYPKKRGQLAINTWHGSLGIKRFPNKKGLVGRLENFIGEQIGRNFDVAISNSAFEDGYYRETYFKKTPIMRLGHARNDLFFNTNVNFKENIKNKVYSTLGIPKDKKICLYGPTFRDDGSLLPYNLPYEKLLSALEERFGGNWIILTRFHPRSKKITASVSFPNDVISATDYPDIQEIMFCADVGITDYSCWICEYIHTGRPGFLYATDLENYDRERGFYDPLDKMPFPLATSSEELIDKIITFNQEEFLTNVDSFLRKKECVDDGHAAERIVDFIEKLVEGKRSQL